MLNSNYKSENNYINIVQQYKNYKINISLFYIEIEIKMKRFYFNSMSCILKM